jgi:hypothetical protein
MRTVEITQAMIERVARKVSGQQIGLVVHKPEPWAEPTNCFRNVEKKMREAGGRVQHGWTFHHRLAEKLPGLPLYLYVTHHAVWHAPDGQLIDVTPYPTDRHKPYCVGNSPVFLLDDKAKPVMAGGQPAPLPLRFFAIDDAAGLAEYVDELNRKERNACEDLYRSAAAQGPPTENEVPP